MIALSEPWRFNFNLYVGMNDFPENLCCLHPDMLVEKEWALNFMEERTIFAMWARGLGAHDSWRKWSRDFH